MHKTLVISTLMLWGSASLAQDIKTSTQALEIALQETGFEESTTVRVETLKSTLFRGGFQDWEFELRDSNQLAEVEIRNDGRQDVEVVPSPNSFNEPFWAQLPEPLALKSVEAVFEQAKEDLVTENPNLTPRNQYIIEYELCDQANADDQAREPTGCREGKPLETWTVFLKSDQTGSGSAKVNVLIYEDGVIESIRGARVGGNW